MYVIKRSGKRERVSLDKVTRRIETLSSGLSIDPIKIAKNVVSGIYNGISVLEIDNFVAQTSATMVMDHPDYSVLAARVSVSSLHKETENFVETTKKLYRQKTLSKEYYKNVIDNEQEWEKIINYERDYNFDYFGYKTLERAYLLRRKSEVIERPQHMYMRTAICLALRYGIDEVKKLYDALSLGYYTHATPTLFNSGTVLQQLSSCFLLAMEDDSIEGIFNTLKSTAKISKSAGGIGLHIHNIRAKGSSIKGTNGISNGIIPMLKVFNETARYVDQGGGKRKGSFAIYLEPWHADIESFLELRRNQGKEEFRARDLFLSLWIPDLFMKRVKDDADWTLMSEDICPGLSDVYGEEFEKLYTKYEMEGKGLKTIKARHLMAIIVENQAESGTPYILYKDHCNRKSNQKNLGTIKSSNLCAEIVEYSDKNETAVCNLASIALHKFVDLKNDQYNFDKLIKFVKLAICNLDRVIDINYYPTEQTKNSNLKHRPVGLGVQSLADVFFKLKIPYESDRAKQLNKQIFETIYYAAVTASLELAKEKGCYQSIDNSPISKGIFQFDMWNCKPSSMYDWETLRKEVKKHGVRNSLLVALMPTASTAQILGNTESFEPQTSNIYKRQTLSGEFIVVNKYLVEELRKINLWRKDVIDDIVLNNGSVQNIDLIPQDIKDVYKTVWEISQRVIIDMAADRAPYICQSQSMNIWLESPSLGQLNSAHFYSWQKGLKTGMYYLRTKAAVNPVKISVDETDNKYKNQRVLDKDKSCDINDLDCVVCSS